MSLSRVRHPLRHLKPRQLSSMFPQSRFSDHPPRTFLEQISSRSPLLLLLGVTVVSFLSLPFTPRISGQESDSPSAPGTLLQVGFGETDITPDLEVFKPIWLAGYGHGRQATGVHDPLMARGVVLRDGKKKIAIVSIDCIGLQRPDVERIRAELDDFDYILVSSTHNHEAPDVIGIWGRNAFTRGVNEAYVTYLVEQTVACVRKADSATPQTVQARFGTAEDESLLHDSRLPVVKDGIIRVLQFLEPDTDKTVGLLVQWSCHPEAMGPKNTLLTADFPVSTIAHLQKVHQCPVVYLSGAVGGLMAPPRDRIRDDEGNLLHEGDFEYARRYGIEVAKLAQQAIEGSQPLAVAPLEARGVRVAIPVANPLYRTARALGILKRNGYVWTGDPFQFGEPLRLGNAGNEIAVETEVAYLRLGELHIAGIPGEIYPELVYGKFQEPVEPNVDYPDAPLEPSVVDIMPGKHWMLFGLANDEIGYILPKRQWDLAPPFAYGRSSAQYGEINSSGPETGPLIMRALQEVVERESNSEAGEQTVEQ
jgi:hypothetical protein